MDQIRVKGIVAFAVVVGLSLIAAAAVGSFTFYRVRSFDNTLSVTGSAKQSVTSDTVKWNAMFSRIVQQADLKAGYAQMTDDREAVMDFLEGAGLTEAEIDISPVQLEENYRYNADPNAPREYTLRQTVRVQSANVEKVTDLADRNDLIDAGLIFATQNLEYYYSKLADLRVSLLSAAVQDAQARASAIAASTGKSVGTLKSASMGVVQVLQPSSTDVSDYGSYDTSTVEKEVMVTVRTSFVLE